MNRKNNIGIVVYENDIETANGKELCRFDELCKFFETENIFIQRYLYSKDKKQFQQNEDLWTMIGCAGRETLPATYVNGRIQKIERYPTKKEIYGWIKR